MQEVQIELSEKERLAKNFFLKLILEGNAVECDTGEVKDIKLELPKWYDDTKFKRGQKYFRENQFGILNSNLFGLLSIISEPKGNKVLTSTNRSNTPTTSRKRYVQTMFHLLSWYEHDLKPGSESWKSLEMVRKMHLMASKQIRTKNLGMISQAEVSMTNFSFMGFVLTRGHLLGVRLDDADDLNGFVHFWAVISYMLGLKDEFNMCKHELEVVKIICEIMRRYVFIPLSQLETPDFLRMAEAYYEGQAPFIPFCSFQSLLFLSKRITGVPGYQHRLDLTKESICKPMLSSEEIQKVCKIMNTYEGYDHFILDNNITVLNIKRFSDKENTNNNNLESYLTGEDTIDKENAKKLKILLKVLELDDPSQLDLTVIPSTTEWRSVLNDGQFKKLSFRDRILVNIHCTAFENNYKSWGHRINQFASNLTIKKMEKYYK